jgi:hypothetical protein
VDLGNLGFGTPDNAQSATRNAQLVTRNPRLVRGAMHFAANPFITNKDSMKNRLKMIEIFY